jgi:hypothetical protein
VIDKAHNNRSIKADAARKVVKIIAVAWFWRGNITARCALAQASPIGESRKKGAEETMQTSIQKRPAK